MLVSILFYFFPNFYYFGLLCTFYNLLLCVMDKLLFCVLTLHILVVFKIDFTPTCYRQYSPIIFVTLNYLQLCVTSNTLLFLVSCMLLKFVFSPTNIFRVTPWCPLSAAKICFLSYWPCLGSTLIPL